MTEKMELEKEKEGIIIDNTGGIMVNIRDFLKFEFVKIMSNTCVINPVFQDLVKVTY